MNNLFELLTQLIAFCIIKQIIKLILNKEKVVMFNILESIVRIEITLSFEKGVYMDAI